MNAAPGIAILIPLTTEKSLITTSTQQKGRVLKGKVIAMGIDLITNQNALLEANRYCKVGDDVLFLSYEGGYDTYKDGGQTYYVVKWEDIRAIL